jgi:hypothetical protein
VKGFIVGVLVGPWLWAGAIFTIWGLVKEAMMLYERFLEWCIQHDEPPSRPPLDPRVCDRSDPMEADESVVRALIADAVLMRDYPHLSDVQRQDILRRRRQEAR